ncbi:MAG: FAD-dependent oxidoreductase [Thermoguttaceae bacterium]
MRTVFGAEGAAWHWQDGGSARIDRRSVDVALNDLTGFEGRCDAIVFSRDPDFVPPNEKAAMAAFRRETLGLPDGPDEAGRFDLVVIGGGIAGTCAALSAARLDLSVALIQDRPVLGGNNSSEVRVWLGGQINLEPHPRVGDIVRELDQARRAHYGPSNTADLYEDDKKRALVEAEENIALFLRHRADRVEMDAGRVTAVVAQNTLTGRRVRFVGRWFADCTGDGSIGFLAGADHDMTLEGHMGRCNLWNVKETDGPVAFPRCPWALDLSDKPFPGRGDDQRGIQALGGWYWESGFDRNPIDQREAIRDWNFRAMYGAWDALKNVDRVYPNHKLNWAAHISGPRESRRLLGDVVLSKEDVVGGKEYTDGCVPATWSIDLHLPDARYETGFEGDAFISKAHYTAYKRPYWVPYRCLYSRNVPNLLMAGRDISVTHEALGAVRVMRTGGMMGEIVGMAASLCKRHDTDPRDVYTDHLDELKALMARGVGRLPTPVALEPPGWLDDVGVNVARSAGVSVSHSMDVEKYPPQRINDGPCETLDNNQRWLGDGPLPHRIEFSWPRPQTIEAARIVSGYRESGGRTVGPIEDFVVEYFEQGEWKQIPAAKTTANQNADWHAKFPAVTTDRVRVTITKTHTGVSRIWEVEFYR